MANLAPYFQQKINKAKNLQCIAANIRRFSRKVDSFGC